MDSWGKATHITLVDNIHQQVSYDATTGIQVGLQSGTRTDHGNLDYTFDVDSFGNVTQRTVSGMDSNQYTETFTYDSLFRLTQYHVAGAAASQVHQAYCYDAMGNLTKKIHGNRDCTTADYTYGDAARTQGNAGSHAVRHIASRGLTFTYDNNGNMLTDGERHIQYDADDRATRITHTAVQEIQFGYGVAGRVWRQDTHLGPVLTQPLADNDNRLTYYHGAIEHVTKTSGPSQGTHQRITLGNVVLTHYPTNAPGQQWQTHVMVQDNQGSTLAIADTQGRVIQRYRYDPYGEQFTITTGYLSAAATKGYLPVSQQGYTGHEMLNNVNIIHMNGRIYDPTIGRFLQADPHIQAPDNLQNYNRYSYVLNNPMSYTDPSGYFFSWIGDAFDSLFKGIHDALGDLAPFAMAIVAVLNPGALLFNNPVSQAVFNGFIGEGIASGSFRGALTGAVSTLAFFDIGEHFKAKFGVDSFFELDGLGQQLEWVGAHALAGGILSQMRGGEFGHGFISAGIQKLASPYVLNTLGIDPSHDDDQFAAGLVGAAIGGTASVATGGKFSNGAKTGFYQTLFNAGRRAVRNGTSNPNQPLINSRAAQLIRQIEELDPSFSLARPNRSDWTMRDIRMLESHLSGLRGAPPIDMTPIGGGASAAYRAARRHLNIPMNAKPVSVLPNISRNNKVQPGYVEIFRLPNGEGGYRRVFIRHDAAGHFYGSGNINNQGPHFNTGTRVNNTYINDGGHFGY